jgi:hypothetical protein
MAISAPALDASWDGRAWALTIAQIAGGIGVMYSRTARPASIVIGAIFLLFSLVLIVGMSSAPTNWVDLFEQFSIVCGAAAVYATTDTNAALSEAFGVAARIALGICVVSFAWAQAAYSQYTASLVPTWIPPSQMFWTILTTIAFALAAIAILINRQTQLALRLLTLMLALLGALVWIPHIIAQPKTLSNWNEIILNYLITGAAWVVLEWTHSQSTSANQ